MLIGPSLSLGAVNPMEHVLPHRIFSEPLFRLFGQPIYLNSHIVMMLFAAVTMVIIFTHMGAKSKRSHVPTGLQNFFEAIASYLRTDVFQPSLGDNADRFAPFLWTVFFFILFCNLWGMVPINDLVHVTDGEMGWHVPEFGGTATGNINVTATLAIIAFIAFHISGIVQHIRIQMDPSLDPHHTGPDHLPPHGHGGTIGSEGTENRDVKVAHHVGDGHDHAHGLHYAHGPKAVVQGKPFPVAVVLGLIQYVKNFVPPVPWWLWFPMLILELIGSLVKPFSLCMRLFANMVAGHMVLVSFVTLIFLVSALAGRGGLGFVVVIASAVFSLLELFVAFLQAYIFVFLTTLFIATAVSPEH
jgi:F0F1-type ATP synthase membrane subunit a